MVMIQKIKQIPFTVIISVIFVVFVLVTSAIANPAATLAAMFILAFAASIVRIVAYIAERLDR